MKNITVSALTICVLLAFSQEQPATAQTAAAQTEPPKMKMTTDIPASITTPDTVETRIGAGCRRIPKAPPPPRSR